MKKTISIILITLALATPANAFWGKLKFASGESWKKAECWNFFTKKAWKDCN